MEDVRFPDGSFDVVLSSLALHYVKDYAELVSRVYRWLTPGGAFVFSAEHPTFTAYGSQDWYYSPEGEILHFPVDRYFYEGEREAVFLGEKVVKYHRTVDSYFKPLWQAGFTVEDLSEPRPPPEGMMDLPGMKDRDAPPDDAPRRRPETAVTLGGRKAVKWGLWLLLLFALAGLQGAPALASPVSPVLVAAMAVAVLLSESRAVPACGFAALAGLLWDITAGRLLGCYGPDAAGSWGGGLLAAGGVPPPDGSGCRLPGGGDYLPLQAAGRRALPLHLGLCRGGPLAGHRAGGPSEPADRPFRLAGLPAHPLYWPAGDGGGTFLPPAAPALHPRKTPRQEAIGCRFKT